MGAGVAGVSAALNLALLGRAPVLIEADSIGSGAAGVSGGVVAPQLPRHGFAEIERKLGRAHAEQLFRLLAGSGHYLFELARDHAPESESAQTGFLAPAMGASNLRRIERIVAGWAPFRSDVSLLGAEAFAELSGVRGYAGALVDSSGGTINPLRYVQGLARSAAGAGARIFCGSPVVEIDQDGATWVLRAPGGTVRARRVILCANGGNAALHPSLHGTVLPMEVCEVTTAPVSPDLFQRILPERHAMTDVEDDVFTIRFDRDGGLVTAYPGNGANRAKITDTVNARLSAAIPGWQPLPLTHVWSGTAWVNTSLVPRLVEVGPNMVAVQACNGRGLALNSVLGRELARWAAGLVEAPPLPFERPSRVAGLFFARYLPQILMRAGLVRKQVKQLYGRSR